MTTIFDFGDGNGPVPAHRHSYGGGWIADTASVDYRVWVGQNARICGGTISGGAISGGTISGGTISGGAIYGGAISGTAQICGGTICGTARISGGTISGGVWDISPLYIAGSRHSVNESTHSTVTIGCISLPLDEWLAGYREIGLRNGYSVVECDEYYQYLLLIAEIRRRRILFQTFDSLTIDGTVPCK